MITEYQYYQVLTERDDLKTKVDEMTAFIERVAEDDNEDNYWMQDAILILRRMNNEHK